MILISNIVLEVLDGSTVASTKIYGADKKTYVNIGSGNVFNLKWNVPTLTNDTVDHYNLVIKRYDPTLDVYYNIFDKNIGMVNKFYVDSDLLPAAPEQYILHIYVVAHGKNSGVVTSNVVTPYICKGSGTYIKVQTTDYTQPIMKRALGFVNAPTDDEIVATLRDITGRKLQILDSDNNPVPFKAEATRLLSSNNWNIIQEGYVKGEDGSWHDSDIKYEVLVAKNAENKFEPIEVFNDEGTAYELLYTL